MATAEQIAFRNHEIKQAVRPACTCKLTNQNNYAPDKTPFTAKLGPGLGDFKIRPPRVYAMDTSLPNIFTNEAPDFSLQWRSGSTRPDPKVQQTPKKTMDKGNRGKRFGKKTAK